MRKKMISLAGVVCMLCVYIRPSSAAELTLGELYAMADSQSVVIRIAEQALLAANQELRQAKNALLPHLQADISGSYIGDAYLLNRRFSASGTTDVILAGLGPQQVQNGRQTTPHWGNNFSFEASQMLYAGGALKANIEMAAISQRIAQLEVDKSRQEVRLMLSSYYLDLVRLQHQSAIINTHIDLTKQVLAMMRSRQEAGTVLTSDITRYELQLKQLELAKIRLQDATQIIQYELQTNMHSPEELLPDTAWVSSEYNRLTAVLSESEWQSAALQTNLNLKQAKAQEDMAEQGVKRTRSASIPKIALVIKDELWGPYTSDLIPINANVNAWFVGIGIHYDIDQLWHNHRAIEKAKIARHIAQEKTTLAQETLANQVHACYASFLTAFTEVATQEKQQELANETYRLVSKRYENDLALITDLLDASQSKLTADLELADAHVRLLFSYYQLKYITHTL